MQPEQIPKYAGGSSSEASDRNIFKLHAPFEPNGDQPQAIDALVKGFKEGNQFETLLIFPYSPEKMSNFGLKNYMDLCVRDTLPADERSNSIKCYMKNSLDYSTHKE